LGQLNGHSEGHKFYYNLKTKTSHWLQEHAEQQPDAGNSKNKPKLSICFIVQKTGTAMKNPSLKNWYS
jgi:hypothetical protein